MNLLYKSKKVISNREIYNKGKISLRNISLIESSKENCIEDLYLKKEILENQILENKKISEEILEKANEEYKNILQKANDKSIDIEKKSYEQGYNQGLKNGYEDGYKESYEDNIQKAQDECEKLINHANEILKSSKDKISDYIEKSKNEILSLSIAIAEQVLREKFEDENSMNVILKKAIKEYKLKSTFIVKTNPIYVESLEKECIDLKLKFNLKDDIFILGDKTIEKGNAVIEYDKGKILIGLDHVLEKIKAELI